MISIKQTSQSQVSFDMEEYLTMASRGEDIQSNTYSSITGTIAYWNDAEPHNQGQYWYFWLKPSGKFSSHSEPWICLVVDENNPSIEVLKTAAESKSDQEFELNVLIMPRQPDYLQFVVSKDDEVKQISSRIPTIKVSDLNGIQLSPIVQPTDGIPIQIHPVEVWSLIVKWIGDLTEDDLKQLFNPLGAESVVMLKSEVEIGEGQAQINFKTQSDAQNALDQTDGVIIKGSVLEVEMQKQNQFEGNLLPAPVESCRLFVGGLSPQTTDDDLKKLFEEVGQVESAVIATKNNGISCGFGFVTMYDIETARMAVTVLNKRVLDGRIIEVSFSRPKPAPVESCRLFVGGLSPQTTSDDLKKLFEEVGQVESAVIATTKSGQSKGFGFVTMYDIETAQKAVTVLNKRVLNGSIVEVSFSKLKPINPHKHTPPPPTLKPALLIPIKPEAIFSDQKTAQQQGNAIIHALDNYNHSTIAYKPVITKGIVRFEGIFQNYKDFPYQIGISESSVCFDSKKEPGDLLYKGKTVCYKNNGCITHTNNTEIAGNAKIEDGQTIALEVNMSTTPRTLTFFINGQQQPVSISKIPSSIKFWINLRAQKQSFTLTRFERIQTFSTTSLLNSKVLQWGSVWNTDIVQEWNLIVKWIGDLSEDDLKEHFNPFGAENVVMLKRKVETDERYAQINFKTQLDAQIALEQTNNKIIKGCVLEIEMRQQQISDQIKSLGELLYEQIERIDKSNAGKITGMLLEHDILDLVKMLEDPHQLFSKVREAQKDLGIAVANEQAPLGPIKPDAIFLDQKTAQQQGNAIIHAPDNYNHSTVAYKPVITKGIVRFEGIFQNYKDFPFKIGISQSSVTFIPKIEPGDIKYQGKTVCYKNNGCITHMNNTEIAGNAMIEDGQTVALEVNMSTTPRTLTFFINGQQQPVSVNNIPPSIKFWVPSTRISAPVQPCRLYVGSLSPQTTPTDLGKLFGQVGYVESANIVSRDEGKNGGFGYVTMCDIETAQRAVTVLDKHVLHGRIIEVQFSEPPINLPKPIPKPNPKQASTNIKLFVRNLNFQTTSDDLKKLFGQVGQVKNSVIATDQSGQSKGFGFVTMCNIETARMAVKILNKHVLNGRSMDVKFSEPKPIDPQMLTLPVGPKPVLQSSALKQIELTHPESIAPFIQPNAEMNLQFPFPGMNQQFPFPGMNPNYGNQYNNPFGMINQQGPRQLGNMPNQQFPPQPYLQTQQQLPQQQQLVHPQQQLMQNPINQTQIPGSVQGQHIIAQQPPPTNLQSHHRKRKVNQQLPIQPLETPPIQLPVIPQQFIPQVLAQIHPDQQKQHIKGFLFTKVSTIDEPNAEKITGMLLELDIPELVNLLGNDQLLNQKICEAQIVLREVATQGQPISYNTTWKKSDFERIKRLGKGAFGSVWRMKEKATSREVAIKEMDYYSKEEKELVDHEKEILIKVFGIVRQSNPSSFIHIVEPLGFFVDQDVDKAYLVLEYCSKEDLRKYINNMKEQGMEISTEKAYEMIVQIASSLEQLHANDIIHSDLKPENVLLVEGFKVKLADFGLARQLQVGREYITAQGGTFLYQGPELLRIKLKDEVVPRLIQTSASDIWAF
ncbi:MAG: putative polyadenylate-binding protein [Streblomastix strix]|uniref:Putative polyadenylate-binding protein n=1 Tax=Streblomastix strix TaxID=222440 RepID=A0A5J4WFE1_9EUKA|nr:MAG: putative polyadenylate-binding protein [Streblomastix strix]